MEPLMLPLGSIVSLFVLLIFHRAIAAVLTTHRVPLVVEDD